MAGQDAVSAMTEDDSAVGEPVAASPGPDFRQFVDTRSQALLRAAFLLTGDVERAEDLLQTALAKSWRHWDRFQRTGEGEAYVRRVLYTTYAGWWRRRWRGERPTAAPPDRPAPGDDYAAVDDRTTLLRALATLPNRQRAVLVLRFFEDLDTARTADVLGCSVGTVKSQTAKALARLRASPAVRALRLDPPPTSPPPRDAERKTDDRP